jgi:hypothetical protein
MGSLTSVTALHRRTGGRAGGRAGGGRRGGAAGAYDDVPWRGDPVPPAAPARATASAGRAPLFFRKLLKAIVDRWGGFTVPLEP